MSACFELFRDKAKKFRWRLKNEGAATIADAVRAYRTKTETMDEIALVRRLAPTATFEVFRDRSGKYRWRLKNERGVAIADSVRSYARRSEANREIELVRRLTPTAILNDLTGPPSVPYDLGALPSELVIRWPAPPMITREAVITSPAAGELRLEQPNTRFVVRANISHLTVATSDIDVQVESGAEIGVVFIEKSLKRIRFRGGRYGKIDVQKPADFNVTPVVWREEWLVEDVLFDRIDVDTFRLGEHAYAFDMRGKRIAILRSHIHARLYSVWVGDTSDFRSEDIILAGNTFHSEGLETGSDLAQATVRLEPAFRSVAVDNRMTNPQKHNYRVHGRSDLAFAARNILIDAGVKLATEPGDQLGTVWLQDNVFHHTLPSLMDLDHPRGSVFQRLIATGNTIYSDVWSYFFTDAPPSGWMVERNSFHPYRPHTG